MIVLPKDAVASADAGQQFATRWREHGLGSNFGGHDDFSFGLRLIDDFADDGGIMGIFASSQGGKDTRGCRLGRKDDQSSFAGQIKRLKAEHTADTTDCWIDGDSGGIKADADLTLLGNLIEDGADAATGCIADDM